MLRCYNHTYGAYGTTRVSEIPFYALILSDTQQNTQEGSKREREKEENGKKARAKES